MKNNKTKNNKSVLVESMTLFQKYPFKVRVWKEETENNYSAEWHTNVKKSFEEIWKEKCKLTLTPLELANIILEIDKINAVEVIDQINLCGVVVYKNWP